MIPLLAALVVLVLLRRKPARVAPVETPSVTPDVCAAWGHQYRLSFYSFPVRCEGVWVWRARSFWCVRCDQVEFMPMMDEAILPER